MKKIISLLLTVVVCLTAVLSFAGCTKTEDLKYDIALITDGGTIKDNSYNESAWNGIERYAEESGLTVTYYQPDIDKEAGESVNTDILEDYVKLATEKNVKFIVLPGEDFAVASYELATAYPQVKFILIDAMPHSEGDASIKLMPNVMSVNFSDLQSGFLAGYNAVTLGETKLGYYGSISNAHSSNYGAGFVQGAAAAADEQNKKVSLDYADYDSPFLDFDYSVNVKAVYSEVKKADKPCRKIVVDNGIGSGTYKDGQNVTVSCDEYTDDGKKFDHWEVKSNTKGVKDKKVNISSKKKPTINLIVGDCDATITPVYVSTDEKVGSVSVFKPDGNLYDTIIGLADSKVTVTAPPAEFGMVFDYWETSGAVFDIDDKESATTEVKLTDSVTTLTPVYKYVEEPTFRVKVEGGDGSGAYVAGDIVKLKADLSKDGYYFEKWEITDSNGNALDITADNEYSYATTFEMSDRFVSVPAQMIKDGARILFAGGNPRFDTIYTAVSENEKANAKVIGAGIKTKKDYFAVVKDYGKAVEACLKEYKGASIFVADCSNECITYTLPEIENADMAEEKIKNVYSVLAKKEITLISAAPGADVRACYKSDNLSLNYRIIENLEDITNADITVVETVDD